MSNNFNVQINKQYLTINREISLSRRKIKNQNEKNINKIIN